ncbi:MAG TPA: hypothetical protein DEQ43_23115 [Nocardioides bacterium]|uniref:hypothetical protein n=1 Tax=uncultured Nocardioides sp. TaxID=198441 RepID=UPI000EE0336F|nr:hypothetical protein [uncultured Nocardioides sp.]HCB07102.1 hypothetical protein [Nocardioides sp.]
MTSTTEPQTEPLVDPTGAGAPPSAAPRPARTLRLALLVALLALLLAGTAAVVHLASTRPVPALGIQGEQAALQSERESAMAQAEQFLLRINTYGPELLEGETMPQYRDLVEEVITAKFAADFEKNAPLAEATVKQAGVGRSAQVYSTGVSAIDDDSATALVAGSFTQSYPASQGSKERVDTEPAPFRVQVSLVKIKGQWLVDDFTPLTGDTQDQPGGGQQSGGLGSTPTQGATP